MIFNSPYMYKTHARARALNADSLLVLLQLCLVTACLLVNEFCAVRVTYIERSWSVPRISKFQIIHEELFSFFFSLSAKGAYQCSEQRISFVVGNTGTRDAIEIFTRNVKFLSTVLGVGLRTVGTHFRSTCSAVSRVRSLGKYSRGSSRAQGG